MIGLFLPAGIVVLAGLVALASITPALFALQLLWVFVGTCLVLLFYVIDWRSLFGYRWVIGGVYAISVFLLIAAYLYAPVIRNTRSWLVIGSFNFQPVELAKVSLILVYAHYFSRRHLGVAQWKNIAASFFYFIVPAIFVMLQPDFGSALVLFGIWFGFLLVSGLPRRRVILAALALALVGTVFWGYVLKDYQKERILGVFYPERDVLGINYSVAQSKTAIGSAGWWGLGYGQGTQTQLKFLTEPATDFIFPAFVEEWGWLAGLVVVGAFLAMIVGILKVGIRADRNFEKFVCLGSALVFAWQFFLNVGSATGIFPVVGVTFPFLSYGGSSLLMGFFLLAIINAIAIRS